MISWLKGKFLTLVGGKVIVLVNGVGYGVWLPEKIKAQLTPDQEVSFYIYTFVREEALELYGFGQKEDLELFALLLAVSGIGPKTALMIVDRGMESVRQAILKADVSFFTTIPRIGKKNAQKIIIELKSKLGSLAELDLEQVSGETQEVMSALQAMGFTKSETLAAIRQMPDTLETIEEKIRYVLKNMKAQYDV